MNHHVPFSERVKSVPAFFGLRLDEQPDYRLAHNLGEFEIRDYPRMILASISMRRDHDDFAGPAFEALANYIFDNEIEMTIPVLQSVKADVWTMSFILPHRLRMKKVPEPNHAGVLIEVCEAKRFAAYHYSGNNTEEKMKSAETYLRDGLKGHTKYQPDDLRWWAQYDQPMALPFMKRNEVLIALN